MIKLLFADDNLLALNQLDQYANEFEGEVLVVGRAGNGLAALELIEKNKPDIAFIDADMPVMNGVELACAVAEKRLPVALIGLSNYDSYDYVRGMMKAGAVDYLLKHELTKESFIEKVREAYARHRPSAESEEESAALSRAAIQSALSLCLLGDASFQEERPFFAGADISAYALVFIELYAVRPEEGVAARQARSALSVVSNICDTLSGGVVCQADDMRLFALLTFAREEDCEKGAAEFAQLVSGNLMRLLRLRAESKFVRLNDADELRGAYPRYIDAPREPSGRIVASTGQLSEHVQRGIEEIRLRYAASITLEKTAKRCFVSPVYLSRRFKAETGVSFIDYLTQYRVNRAKALLFGTNRPVKDVGVSTGFRDDSYFIKVFKQKCGLTPSEYRALSSRSASVPPDGADFR